MKMPDEEIQNLKKDKLDASIIVPLIPTNPLVTNYAGYNNSYCYKVGHKVVVHIGIKIDTEDAVNAFILPERYRPHFTLAAVGIGSSVSNISALQVYSSGVIYIQSNYTYSNIDFEFDLFD